MDLDRLESLLQPASYPEPTGTVQHLQTHISHLFLTDQYVYKLKKTVDFGFLDFTTLEKRRHFCHEEVRLNRRLSPDIYLGVVELRDDGHGGLCFTGEGEVREYAVKMRRLPGERMLDHLLDTGGVSRADMEAIAAVLARFHAGAVTGPRIAAFGAPAALRANWLEDLRQTEQYRGITLSVDDHRLIGDWALATLTHDGALFERRIAGGFIRECDGDLHSGNICLDGQVHIFDGIEFNEQFRFSDTAADVAFLAMDLENHGRRDLAEAFVADYRVASGDDGVASVLPFYLLNRAFIRGKVESFRLSALEIPRAEQEAAADRARRFFRLSRGYLLRCRLPATLFITCGPTGCGKSSLAEELAFQLGFCHIQADQVRKRLAGVAVTARGAPIYTPAWNRATYSRLAELAGRELSVGRSVLVDATFQRRSDRRKCAALALQYGVRLVILVVAAPAQLIRERLERRSREGGSVSDGTWQVYQRQIASFEPPQPDEGLLVSVDARQNLVTQVEQVLAGIGLFS